MNHYFLVCLVVLIYGIFLKTKRSVLKGFIIGEVFFFKLKVIGFLNFEIGQTMVFEGSEN